MTRLIAFEGKIWKSVVMNSVMNAKIDPKVVMELSILKIGGWNYLQPSYQNLLEEFLDENEPWLWDGIPSRDPFLVTQYLEQHSASSDQHMKKMMSIREGLHVMMQCYMRQHCADRFWLREHPVAHASWREPTMRKFTKESTTYFVRGLVCRWNVQKMQAQSSEDVRKKKRLLLKQLENQNSLGESHIEERAKDVFQDIG